MKLTESPTRLIFFTGKGGMGKTTGAAAVAQAQAARCNLVLTTTAAAAQLSDPQIPAVGIPWTSEGFQA